MRFWKMFAMGYVFGTVVTAIPIAIATEEPTKLGAYLCNVNTKYAEVIK